ncbi:MAG: Gfo/Idh/MocA family oxidoreductase [Lentisphaeria bacterium]|nr:Gfo/Idh/MocA family oxidoreductase [Lentisphaeria bacterium]
MADDSTSLGSERRAEYTGKRFRIGMIGCGGISKVHIDAYKDIPEVEIVAACDIIPERMEHVRKECGLAPEQCFTDYEVMIREVKMDGVDICTPNGVHCAPAVAAANAGCHVFVEKPMAISVEQAEQMVAAAKANNVKLAVGFQNRYRELTDFLTRARDVGELGEIMYVRVQALRRRGIPPWGDFTNKAISGGGPLIDIGVHMIEVAHEFMGAPKPVAVSANTWSYIGTKPCETECVWGKWDHTKNNVEDLAIAQVRFENGAIMQIEAAFAAHVKEEVRNFTFMGTKGGGQWSPAVIYTDQAGTMVDIVPNYLPDKQNWHILFGEKLRNWVHGAMYDKPLRASGEAGLAVQKILNGVYESAAAGREVKIE